MPSPRPRLLQPAIFAALGAILGLTLSAGIVADTLNMPGQGQSAPATSQSPANKAPAGTSVTLPGRGMTMEEVESRFGAPQQRFPEVGDPPIIRWVYGAFSVYFEYQYVIHAVMHSSGKPAPTPSTMDESDAAGTNEATAPSETTPPAMAQ